MKSFIAGVVSIAAAAMSAETISLLDLASDLTVDVPAGTTTDVARVTGGAYTITKTGGGMLRFGWIRNSEASLVVREGSVDFYRPPKPACLANAFLHVDANVLDSAYVTTENGTNFVTRWTDASGGDNYAEVDRTKVGKWRTDATIGTPFVLQGYQNGLDVIDFGHYQQANIVDDQGVSTVRGAAMIFNAVCKPVRDVFAVAGYREEIKTVKADYRCTDGSPLLSCTNSQCFLPPKLLDGANPPLFNYWQGVVVQALCGEVTYNDTYKKGTTTGSASNSAGAQSVPEGLFYLHVRPATVDEVPESIRPEKDNTALDAFARDRTFNFGGQRIGEYIVFQERLSDEDRDAVENYLRVKWFPLQQSFKSVSFAGGAAISLASGQKQLISRLPDGIDLTVEDGHVEIDALRHTGAWIHLDASKSSTMLQSEEAGQTYVTNWYDADGGVRSAAHCTRVNTWRADPENRRPFLSYGVASNSLPVIDFGFPQNEKIIDSNGKGVGYGAAMRFDTDCAAVRETMAVAGDREEAASIIADYPSPGNSASFIGGRKSDCVNFFRSAFESGKYPLVINPWNNGTKGIWGHANGVAIDGVLKNSGASVRLPDSGLHLVNFRMTENGYVSGLAQDENFAYGGVRLGEVLVFESELADDDRSRISGTLMTKWMNRPPYVYACGTVRVADGCDLSIPYAAVSADRLVLGGTVAAEKVAADVIEIVSPDSEIDGVLDMSEPGEIVLTSAFGTSFDVGSTVKLLSASSVTGDESEWTVSGPLTERWRFVLSAEDDGLYANVYGCGLTIILK